MSNVEDLRAFVSTLKVGQTAEVATSQYASNTTPEGHTFDFWSTAPAVRSLIKQGVISGWCGWRYYDIKRLK